MDEPYSLIGDISVNVCDAESLLVQYGRTVDPFEDEGLYAAWLDTADRLRKAVVAVRELARAQLKHEVTAPEGDT